MIYQMDIQANTIILKGILLLASLSWLVVFYFQAAKDNTPRSISIYMIVSTVTVVFYWAHYVQVIDQQGPWHFPIGAQIALVGIKFSLAFWTAVWVMTRSRQLHHLLKFASSLSILSILGLFWSSFVHF